MKILITGSNGLLGQTLVTQCQQRGIDFVASSFGSNRNPHLTEDKYTSLDITDSNAVQEVLHAHRPSVVINTAAMTNVDACEEEKDKCWQINVEAVSHFMTFKSPNCKFIQLSTDFVFDGLNGPYKETDAPNPLSHYARSKWASEKLLQKSKDSNWAIARTIIVYGLGENLSRGNIVSWAVDSLSLGKELNIVNDQFRSPTWAPDLAEGCCLIAEKDATGIFHLSGPEFFSMYDMVVKIAEMIGADPKLISPITSEVLDRPAPRPPRTGFDISKSKNELNYAPHTLQEALKAMYPEKVS